MAWSYTPLGGGSHRFRSPRYNLVLATAILSTIAAIVLFLLRDGHRRAVDRFPFSTLPPTTCDAAAVPSTSDDIPNLVHYVWLTRDPSLFTLDFKAFVTVYSSHLFLRPTHIYIHTDAHPAAYQAAAASGPLWTRRVLAIPGVVPNYVSAPSHTTSGVPLDRIEHKSDVIRLQALKDFGGLYLDFDAIPLRDISPLRTAGFGAVVGPVTAVSVWQSGMLNNGAMLSRPHSPFIEIYYEAYHKFFTGEWDRASVVLLTDLAMRVAAVPRAVLLVESRAFAPFSWEVFDMNRLYGFLLGKPREGEGGRSAREMPGGLAGGSCLDARAWLEERERGGGNGGGQEEDLSGTYVLHAFDANLGAFHGLFSPRVEVDLGYVMRRESNYARAVWPAIKHAIEAGLIPEVGE
ncbi:hypothetical protein QBC39DRAFT_344904 [Podospora conica]|nr:hypothetical protein QBC39DRAFT_344904 [Schizothecium conicum]